MKTRRGNSKTLYDSSVLIGYLDGADAAVEYVDTHHDERAVAPPLVFYEVYRGEVSRSGPADIASVDTALEWVTPVASTVEHARVAAELRAELRQRGDPLAARDALIAGTALASGEQLGVADSDSDIGDLTELVAIDFL